jgi:peptidoglycan/LPS O-acetylase OafA/YrhL
MNKTNTVNYFPSLDGLRAIAVLWVMLHHMRIFFHVDGFLTPVLRSGSLGVDIFFVISGFLITGLLITHLSERIHIRRFYIHRFFKIVPQFYALLFIQLIFLASADKILPYLFFMQNYFPSEFMLMHTWSLAVEEHFYIVYPLLLVLIYKVTLKNQRFIATMITLLSLIILGNIIRMVSFSQAGFFEQYVSYQTTHVRFDELLAGCVLRFVYERWKGVPLLKLAGCACLAGIILTAYLALYFHPKWWWHYTLSYIATCLLISSTLWGFRPLKNILEYPILMKIGRCSYGIYIWHYIICILSIFLVEQVFRIPLIYGIVLYFVVSILVGAFSTWTLERYFLDLRKKLLPS